MSLFPKHGKRGNLEDYINLKRNEGRIDFVFEFDGEIYETRRVISRKAGKNCISLSAAESLLRREAKDLNLSAIKSDSKWTSLPTSSCFNRANSPSFCRQRKHRASRL
ncbi:MAG: hypothetical protein ACLUSP_02105 [Christensenellales bacterium]